MKFKLSSKLNTEELSETECLVLNIFKKENKSYQLDKNLFNQFDNYTKTSIFEFLNKNFLEPGDTKIVFLPKGKISKLILNVIDQGKYNLKNLIINIRKIIKIAKGDKIKSLSLIIENWLINNDYFFSTKTITENALMANFDFSEQFKQKPRGGWKKIEKIKIFSSENNIKNNIKMIKEGIDQGSIIGQEVNHARILANMPAGQITPESLAEAALTAGNEAGFKVEIFDEKKIKELGMGGILGVAAGSNAKPRFIILEYINQTKEKPLAFIGKGITFDSGGLNLKPSESMTDMHLDMSGGAAVIHAISAIAKLKLPINIYGFIPAAENMPSGSSYRPGDILKTMSGKTIEVLNTDAEGRIILADAIEYAKTKNPSLILDLATLTGASIIALGQRVNALFTKDQKLQEFLIKIGEDSGDYVWPLPLWDEYEKDIEGTFADITNVGKTRYGGAINGAAFLWYFAKPKLWAHLDIAPTMTTIEEQFLAKGASGSGVRFLIELAKRWKEFSLPRES